MSYALFFTNICKFGNNCNLTFASTYDLIHHIEETHIPSIEAEEKKKSELERNQCQIPQQNQTQTIPLSALYRLFPNLPIQRPKPIRIEESRCSFNHNKRKTSSHSFNSTPNLHKKHQSLSLSGQRNLPLDKDDDNSNDSFQDEFEEWTVTSRGFIGNSYINERKYKCPVSGCNKRYKNLQGVRYHSKIAHGNVEKPSTTTSRPYKCNQCIKRYKTSNGLQNHVQSTHRPGQGKPSTTLVPVSPSAVSNSDRGSSTIGTCKLNQSTAPIHTDPPPHAGGHQYYQSTNIVPGGPQQQQMTRMLPQRNIGGGLSFTVPIMQNDISPAATVTHSNDGKRPGVPMTIGRQQQQQQHSAGRGRTQLQSSVPQHVISVGVPHDPLHPVAEVVVSATNDSI